MPKPQIMIVEDESIAALSIQRQLKRLGYGGLMIVTTGEEAVMHAEKTRPDLVLMDIMLAGEMDGVTAATQIRQQFRIPIIYLTAYADEKTRERAKIAEPFGYILKPFEDKNLYLAIEMALYKHQAEMERERLIAELQEALATIKTLHGLLPICASCKNIRDDQGYWHRVEAYIQEHSEAEFIHSFCPDCAKKMYPGLYSSS